MGDEAAPEDEINLWPYFSNSCYNGFNDRDEDSFWNVYRNLFELINEQVFAHTSSLLNPNFLVLGFYGPVEEGCVRKTLGTRGCALDPAAAVAGGIIIVTPPHTPFQSASP